MNSDKQNSMLDVIAQMERDINEEQKKLEGAQKILEIKISFLQDLKNKFTASNKTVDSLEVDLKNKQTNNSSSTGNEALHDNITQIDAHDIFGHLPQKRITFIEDVKNLILTELKNLPEFETMHVEHIYKLRKNIDKSDKTNYRGKISTVLSKLLQQNLIKITYQGSGNVPNRYKVVSEKPSAATEGFSDINQAN